MTFFQELTSNQTLMTGVTGWVVAQVLKTILDIGLNHSFNPAVCRVPTHPLYVRWQRRRRCGTEWEALNFPSALFWRWLLCMTRSVSGRRQESRQEF